MTRSVQELAQEMVDEIEQGIDGTELKAGIIRRSAPAKERLRRWKRRYLLPLRWRITRPDAQSPRIRRSAPWGWNNWLCCKPTELIFARHRWSLQSERQPRQHFEDDRSGAYVQFDTIGKNSYYPDEKRIAMLHALRDRGLLNRVMLSMDITRRSHLKANGGYGYDYLLTTFIPQLRQSGFSQADVDVMLRENPSQFFQ